MIAFIPLRGGSKSIPGKNIKSFCGKPLCYWTIKAAEDALAVSSVIVATDDESIINTVQSFNFPKVVVYRRSAENAQDNSSTESVMIEWIEKQKSINAQYFALIQATNPFLTPADIDKALSLLQEKRGDSLLTCVNNKRFFWTAAGQPINYDFRKRPRRQDFEGVMMENGALYINTIENIRKHSNRLSGEIVVYEMPEYTAFEIDEPDDWLIMEKLFAKHYTPTKTKRIKLFITDVDGVLTDAGMYYTESGDELKKFNTHDGMGLKFIKDHGVKTALITTENTKMVERRAKKLSIDYLYQGKGFGSKLESALDICKKEGIDIAEVAYVGDDINCKQLLESVGVAACPANALDIIKSIPGIIHLNKKGGDGAVREFIDWLIEYNLVP